MFQAGLRSGELAHSSVMSDTWEQGGWLSVYRPKGSSSGSLGKMENRPLDVRTDSVMEGTRSAVMGVSAGCLGWLWARNTEDEGTKEYKVP